MAVDGYDAWLMVGAASAFFLILFPHTVHVSVFGLLSPHVAPHQVHVLSGIAIGIITFFYADKRYNLLS
jgi:hypothetical protein